MPGLPSVFQPSPFKLYLETTTAEGSSPPLLKRTIPQELPSTGSIPALQWSLDRFQAISGHTKAHPPCCEHDAWTIVVTPRWKWPGEYAQQSPTVGAVPSDVLLCRCFYKLLCCSLGAELFPFPSREGNAAGSSCAQKRKTQHKRNRNHREQSKGSLISYGLVSCILSRLWPFLFSSVTSPDCPSTSLLPLVLALAFVCVCQPNNPCSRSEILVTAQSGRAKVQVAFRTRSQLGARCVHVQWGNPMGQARTARVAPLHTLQLPKTGISGIPPPQPQSSSHKYPSHRPT